MINSLLFFQRNEVQFPAPASGSSHLTVTPAPENLMPFSSFRRPLHALCILTHDYFSYFTLCVCGVCMWCMCVCMCGVCVYEYICSVDVIVCCCVAPFLCGKSRKARTCLLFIIMFMACHVRSEKSHILSEPLLSECMRFVF